MSVRLCPRDGIQPSFSLCFAGFPATSVPKAQPEISPWVEQPRAKGAVAKPWDPGLQKPSAPTGAGLINAGSSAGRFWQWLARAAPSGLADGPAPIPGVARRSSLTSLHPRLIQDCPFGTKRRFLHVGVSGLRLLRRRKGSPRHLVLEKAERTASVATQTMVQQFSDGSTPVATDQIPNLFFPRSLERP